MWTFLCVLFLLATGLPLLGIALSMREMRRKPVCPLAWSALSVMVTVFLLAATELPGAISADVEDYYQCQAWFREVQQFASEQTPVHIIDRSQSLTLCAMGEEQFFLPTWLLADDIQSGDNAVFVTTARTYRLKRQ